jgi:hypothetical protein
MPPWLPNPGPVPFLNEARLNDHEIDLFQRWADAGAPEGDAARTPPPPHFPEGWRLGAPDQVYTVPVPIQIPADGPDLYRCIVLSTDSVQNRYVKGYEFRPENRRLVHHSFLFVDTSGLARKLDEATPEPGYSCQGGPGFMPSATLGVWVPGWPMPPLPGGLAEEIPKGADLVVQIHYHPTGKPEQDRPSVGLKFSGKPDRLVTNLYLNNYRLSIPAGDSRHAETFATELPTDTDLVSILPHAHYLARDLAADAYLPDGSKIPLVHIGNWNFNWQGLYYYSHPIRLPRRTTIKLTYVYDNSDGNPRNPSHPPKPVSGGETTTDEMQLAILGVAPAPGADAAKFQRLLNLVMFEQRLRNGQDITRQARDNRRLGLLVRYFDRDHDGTLDESEAQRLIAFLERWTELTGSPYLRAVGWGLVILACLFAFLLMRAKVFHRRGLKRSSA